MPANQIKMKFLKHTPKYALYMVLLLLFSASSLFFSSCSRQEDSIDPEPARIEEQAENRDQENGDEENQKKTGNICNDMDFLDNYDIPRVGLYTGQGSWQENVEVISHFLDHYGFEWSGFDEQEAVSADFERKFDLLWFPGGFAAEYKNYITDHSNIRDFVSDGGLFIGSCAGAYYASDILRWQGTDYDYPLKLFPGKGVGPLAGLIGWGEVGRFELDQEHPANRGFNPEIEFYYFDGPYFAPYDQTEVNVLARYQVNNEPAVIAGDKGSGKYLLLGPHPEIGGYSEQSPRLNTEGEEEARWPWLYQVILWFSHHCEL